MAGQAYVDTLMAPGVLAQAAVIRGADGTMKVGGPSAASAGLSGVTPAEGQMLANAFNNNNHVRSKGFYLAGTHYEVVHADARSIYGKNTLDEGVVAIKTNKVFLIGTYSQAEQHDTAVSIVESLGDCLTKQGQ